MLFACESIKIFLKGISGGINVEKRLLKKIEVLRKKLYRYATTRSLVDARVVELSQELDYLLNQYQRLNKYTQLSFW
ncbi:Spo0E like sporulation regulatory protein [Desulfitobacterium sp. LBE]|uniref:Spo0E like sporulation regulatory protein n=3 Tax=Desulfitobacterium hafniense TaxID=49338 RepID=A0A098AUJ2_DESHA|nr:hypothetical protein Dhaf_0049 [Desulfitobacterium hafniense DCB-2]EHL05259.1 Spo0E like sporulation regulatory protein [Desulfitobacterium hafniense DP7]TWH58966.1 Spo0E like sporulation regulatory protein [Desulfitobacterium sp. LBE]CDX00089.1 Spo0E like sporulation regulatory protein [Desulfitobacterium hafniense]